MDERILSFFDGELSRQERISLLRELETNRQLKRDMLSFQNARALFALVPERIDPEAGRAGRKRFLGARREQRMFFFLKKATGYAAAIFLTVVITLVLATTGRNETHPVAFQQEIFVPPGQRARITLPDGSVAWLNAGSSLSYPSFFDGERRVNLIGEAYFDVAHTTGQSFVVTAGSLEIKALGTQFNVKAYPKTKQVNAILVDGSIKVYKPGTESEGTILEPNQQLRCEEGRFTVEKTIDKDDLLWKDGIYNFKKERLNTIVKKLELYYDVDIIVKDPDILQHEYTGKFRQSDGVMEILRIIRKIHHFKIEKNDELNRITILN